MTAPIRKRREQRAGYDVALASWHALDKTRHCRGCQDTSLINHEDAALPCPMCHPDEAREAARGARP